MFTVLTRLKNRPICVTHCQTMYSECTRTGFNSQKQLATQNISLFNPLKSVIFI